MQPNILPTIFTATGNYTPAVIGMTEATDALGLASKKASKSMGLLSVSSKGVGLTGFSFLAGSIGILAMGTALGVAGKEAMDFQQQMGNVATLVDTNVESMGAMSDAVMKLGKVIPKPISDLTEGLYYIRSAGVDAANAMDVLKQSGILATTGLSTVTEAAKGITSAMVDFKNEGLSTEQIANSFFLTVQQGKTKMDAINESFGQNASLIANAGVKLEEYLGATAALTNSGMEASFAEIGIANTIISLIKPTKEMSAVFSVLHVKTGEQLIAMDGYGGALDAVAAAAKGLNIEQAKLYNKTGYKVEEVLSGQLRGQRVTDTEEQFKHSPAIMTAFQKQMANSAQQFQVFKNGLTQLGVSIGNILLPPLNALMNVLNPIFSAISTFTQNHKFLSELILISGAAYGLNSAFGIMNGVLKISSGLFALNSLTLKTLNMMLLTGAASSEIAATAFTVLKMSLLPLLPVAGLVVGILGIIGLKMKYASDEADVMAHSIKQVKDGFIEVITPINQATVALNEFNKKYNEYVEKQNEYQTAKYLRNQMRVQHPIEFYTKEALSFLPGMRTNAYEANGRDTIPLPKIQDYGDTTGNQINKQDTLYDSKPTSFSGSKESLNDTNAILNKIAGLLSNQPTPQLAYANNGASAPRIPPTVNSTFSRRQNPNV